MWGIVADIRLWEKKEYINQVNLLNNFVLCFIMTIDLIPAVFSLLEDKNTGRFIFISYSIFHRNGIFKCFSRLE